jgi:hypothetical protein
MQNDSYRSIKAISNSLMGTYEEDFPAFVSYWVYNKPLASKSTLSLTRGSLIDTLLTCPEEFNTRYSVYDGKAPKGQMESYCRTLARLTKGKEITDEMCLSAYEEVGFKRDKIETVKKEFEEYQEFYDALIACDKCEVVTKVEHERVRQKYLELSTGLYTRNIVNAKTDSKQEVFHQLELVSTLLNVKVKGALDKVIVNHLERKIYLIDYKTSSNILEFEKSYFKYNYFRQGSFYTDLILDWMRVNGWEDYTIEPFVFVVCSTTSSKHFCYQMTEIDIEYAKYGGTTRDSIEIKGWYQILEEIKWMTKTNNWLYPYKVSSNNGIVPLNIFKNE